MFQKISNYKIISAVCLSVMLFAFNNFAQEIKVTTRADKAERKIQEQEAKEKAKKAKQDQEKLAKEQEGKPLTAEQIAEFAIILNGGREGLARIRKTEIERGKITSFQPDGKTAEISYETKIVRGDNLEKDRWRFDQKTPTYDFALVLNQNKIYGITNDTVFQLRQDIRSRFDAQMWQGLEALLRYKENGSTLKLLGKNKQMGVEFNTLEMTDKVGRITRYNISTKTYRVLSAEYEQVPSNDPTAKPNRYMRKFYDYRIAQGTLVPYRIVLFENDRQIEEMNVLTVTYGIKLDESLFGESGG